MRLCVLIPEFPGQTHSFFLREIDLLRAAGHEVVTASTRPPPPNERASGAAFDAEARRCVYLGEPARLATGAATAILATLGSAPRRSIARLIREADSTSDTIALLKMLPAGAALASLARRHGIDHVHVHSCANAATVATVAQALGGPPYSLTLHTRIDAFGGMQRLKWRHASVGLLVADALRQGLIDAVGDPNGLPPLTVAPMGIDPDAFRLTEEERATRANGRSLRVVTCGRLHPGKGHDDLVRATARLAGEGRDVSLAIIGEGADRSRLEALIGGLDLTGRVELLGQKSQPEIRDILARSDVFALASHNEAIGVATMEAMAMELPVVVTDVGGVHELVQDGETGLMVKPHEPDAIADAIRTLDDDRDLARTIATAGARRVAEGFTSRVRVERLLTALGDQVSSHAS